MPEWLVPSFLQYASGSRGEMDIGRGCGMTPNHEFRDLEGWVCLLLAAQQRGRDTPDTPASWKVHGKGKEGEAATLSNSSSSLLVGNSLKTSASFELLM